MATPPQNTPSPRGRPVGPILFLLLVVMLGGVYFLRDGRKGGGETLSPPSVTTGLAAEVTGTSALLTATVRYGDYPSVDLGFRWREVGGSWNFVPWYTGFTGVSSAYRLSNLLPGRTYEFQALLRFDGQEVEGEIRSFTTPTPPTGFQMSAGLRGYPPMSFTARLVGGKVRLTVTEGLGIGAWKWEWRVENEDGPVTSYATGTQDLLQGTTVELDVSVPVSQGSLGVGDKVRVRYKPSDYSYSPITIS